MYKQLKKQNKMKNWIALFEVVAGFLATLFHILLAAFGV